MPNRAKYAFAVGRPFPKREAQDPSEYLQAVLDAERYIASHQRENADGIYWEDSITDGKHLSLYSGATGILYFYLELYKATYEARFANIVNESARYLVNNWRETTRLDEKHHLFPSSHYDEANGSAYPGEEFSLKIGPGGVGLVLSYVYREFRVDSVKETVTDIASHLIESARIDEKGARWSGNTGIYLDGGSFLFLVRYHELFLSESDAKTKETVGKVRAFIDEYGKYLLSTTRTSPNGGYIVDGTNLYREFSMPNLEVGTAGGGYQLSRLYQVTGDERYLDAAREAAVYLRSIAVPQTKGVLIPARVNNDGTLFRGNADLADDEADEASQKGDLAGDYTKPVYYLGDCNGVAGSSRLFYNLYKITSDRSYLDYIYSLEDGLESIGAPDFQSSGCWNGVHFCCGLSGVLQYFVGLYEETGDPRWRDLIIRGANVLLGETEEEPEGGLAWPVAWERIWPNDLSVSLGYYTGSAGIAASLLQAYLALNDKFEWDRFADDPFPDRRIWQA